MRAWAQLSARRGAAGAGLVRVEHRAGEVELREMVVPRRPVGLHLRDQRAERGDPLGAGARRVRHDDPRGLVARGAQALVHVAGRIADRATPVASLTRSRNPWWVRERSIASSSACSDERRGLGLVELAELRVDAGGEGALAQDPGGEGVERADPGAREVEARAARRRARRPGRRTAPGAARRGGRPRRGCTRPPGSARGARRRPRRRARPPRPGGSSSRRRRRPRPPWRARPQRPRGRAPARASAGSPPQVLAAAPVGAGGRGPAGRAGRRGCGRDASRAAATASPAISSQRARLTRARPAAGAPGTSSQTAPVILGDRMPM